MTPKRTRARVTLVSTLVASALLMLAGCTGPTYKTEHYTLLAEQEPNQRVAATFSSRLGVGPIRLPESLHQRAIVSRGDSQRLAVAPYAVWAGDLKDSITRVLADDLSSYLDTSQVWPFPWDNRMRPERQVSIIFERFGGVRGGEVELQAKWRLLADNGERLLHTDKFSARTEAASSSYDSYVAALNQLLHQLAWDIARVAASESAGGEE